MRSAGAAKILNSHGIEAYNGGAWQTADALTRYTRLALFLNTYV